jgi:PadR family transcriptional regulator, regulatory protein PadR
MGSVTGKEQQERIALRQGTVDLLMPRTLVRGPALGHALANAIEFNSDEVLQVEQGSLYPGLHRLIKNNRRAKFYRPTAKGSKQLAIETSKWERLARAIGKILPVAE